MAEQRFNHTQRFAIYEAFSGICPWCNRHLDFLAMNIDHVIPESLLQKPDEKAEVYSFYNIPEGFDIRGYENLAPLHSQCNAWKSDSTFKGSGIILRILGLCAKNKERVQRIESRVNKEPNKAELITQFRLALERSALNIWELQQLVLHSDIMDTEDDALSKIRKRLEDNEIYKAEKTVQEYMTRVTNSTVEVINEMSEKLQPGWGSSINAQTTWQRDNPDERNNHTFHLYNSTTPKLTVTISTKPKYSNKRLSVELIIDGQVVEAASFDADRDIDWIAYKKLVREVITKKLDDNMAKYS